MLKCFFESRQVVAKLLMVVALVGLTLTQLPQLARAALPLSACNGKFPALGTVTLCVCDTATGNLIVEGANGRDTEPNSLLCLPSSSSSNARINAALASLSAEERASIATAAARFIDDLRSSGTPSGELPTQEEVELNIATTGLQLPTFWGRGVGGHGASDVGPNVRFFRPQQSYSPAVFDAMEQTVQGANYPSAHALGIASVPPNHERQAAAQAASLVDEQGWRLSSSARLSHSYDDSSPQTQESTTASLSIGGYHGIGARMGLAFQASLSGTQGHTSGTPDDHNTTSLAITAGLPARLENGLHFAPIASYQRGWVRVEETVAGNQTVSDLDTHTFSVGAVANRRWYWPDEERQALYYLEPQAMILQSWQHVESYRRSDGQVFGSQTNASSAFNLSLTAGALLPTDWQSVVAVQPSLQLEAGYVQDAGSADGLEAGVTARLRFITRSPLIGDVSLGYRAGNERRTVFARAAVRVPLQP